MIKKPQMQDNRPQIYDTSQIQRHAGAGPSGAPVIKKEEQQPQERAGPPAETPNLLAGLINLEGIDEEQEAQISKLRKAKDQFNIEGNIRTFNIIEAPREALCVKYNEEFDYIAAGYSDGVIRVFKSNTGELAFTLADPEVQNVRAPCTSLKHRPLSKMYPITNCFTATYANGCVKCWSYHFSQCVYTIKEKRQTFGITYHPRFPKFVTFGDDLKIHFYDEETRTQERILLPSEYPEHHDGHMSRIFAACFHPKNNYEVITGGWDDVIQFWDLRQPYAMRHISGCHICGEGLDINPRGTERLQETLKILAGSFQVTDALQLFDYGSGRRIASLEPDIYPSKLYCAKYISKDVIMTGGADPHLIRFVDLQSTANAALIHALNGGVYSMDIGPMRKQKYEKDKKEVFAEEAQVRTKTDLSGLPRVAFISSKKIFQMDFY